LGVVVPLRRAIHFDRELRGGAVEVDDHRADDMLAAEDGRTGIAAPEAGPEQHLGAGHRLAKRSGAFRNLGD
jgi:hypothetical protein